MNAREWAWNLPNVRGLHQHVLLALVESYNPWSGWCRASVAQLAERTGYDRSTVWRALRSLEATHIIRSGLPGTYALPLERRKRRPVDKQRAGQRPERRAVQHVSRSAMTKEQVKGTDVALCNNNRSTVGRSSTAASPTDAPTGLSAAADAEVANHPRPTPGTPPPWAAKPQVGDQIGDWKRRKAAGLPIPAWAEQALGQVVHNGNGKGER